MEPPQEPGRAVEEHRCEPPLHGIPGQRGSGRQHRRRPRAPHTARRHGADLDHARRDPEEDLRVEDGVLGRPSLRLALRSDAGRDESRHRHDRRRQARHTLGRIACTSASGSWPRCSTTSRITGEVAADLFVSTSGSDADVVVKLIDVYPEDAQPNTWDPEAGPAPGQYARSVNGYELPIAMEVRRGRYLASYEHPHPLTPNTPLEWKIPLRDRDHVSEGSRPDGAGAIDLVPPDRPQPAKVCPEHLRRDGGRFHQGDPARVLLPHLAVAHRAACRAVGRPGGSRWFGEWVELTADGSAVGLPACRFPPSRLAAFRDPPSSSRQCGSSRLAGARRTE